MYLTEHRSLIMPFIMGETQVWLDVFLYATYDKCSGSAHVHIFRNWVKIHIHVHTIYKISSYTFKHWYNNLNAFLLTAK